MGLGASLRPVLSSGGSETLVFGIITATDPKKATGNPNFPS